MASSDRSAALIRRILSTPFWTSKGSMICSASSMGSNIPMSSPHVLMPFSKGGSGGACGIFELEAVRSTVSSASSGAGAGARDGLLGSLVGLALLHGTYTQLLLRPLHPGCPPLLSLVRLKMNPPPRWNPPPSRRGRSPPLVVLPFLH